MLLHLKHVRMTDFHSFRVLSIWEHFLPNGLLPVLAPWYNTEPAQFLKISGEVVPPLLSDTRRFSTWLAYWWIVAEPFSSDIHCMTRFFTQALPPPMPSFLHFTWPIRFPLIVFLGWWELGGRGSTAHKTFWASGLERSAWFISLLLWFRGSAVAPSLWPLPLLIFLRSSDLSPLRGGC